MKGRVKWWSNEKGYGFIEYLDNSNVFVYLNKDDSNQVTFREGQKIEFDLEQTEKGTYLKNLKKLSN